MEELFKKCEVCDGNTQTITCETNPNVGEWYCPKCYKSYLMPRETNLYLIRLKKGQGA